MLRVAIDGNVSEILREAGPQVVIRYHITTIDVNIPLL
jgi:hypothetical protein